MNINSDINILGGLPDFNLISQFLKEREGAESNADHQVYTSIKTSQAVTRFRRVINSSILKYANENVERLVVEMIKDVSISPDSLLMIFWNLSFNNELMDYLNEKVYFPALFGGRAILEIEEVKACLQELRTTEPKLHDWSVETLDTTASKYLTLLKKLNLLSGTAKKKILIVHLDDKLLILFLYWLTAVEPESNLANSQWLKYSFSDKHLLIERLFQRKFSKYISLNYTGDKLKVETLIPYENICHALSKS